MHGLLILRMGGYRAGGLAQGRTWNGQFCAVQSRQSCAMLGVWACTVQRRRPRSAKGGPVRCRAASPARSIVGLRAGAAAGAARHPLRGSRAPQRACSRLATGSQAAPLSFAGRRALMARWRQGSSGKAPALQLVNAQRRRGQTVYTDARLPAVSQCSTKRAAVARNRVAANAPVLTLKP